MAEKLYYMDLTAGSTATLYPSNGNGGTTAALASAFTTEDVGDSSREFVIIGIIALAADAADCDVTITGDNGTAVVGSFASGYGAWDYLPLPWVADTGTAQNPPPLFGTTATFALGPNAGVAVGRTFTAAMSASTASNFRIVFGVA